MYILFCFIFVVTQADEFLCQGDENSELCQYQRLLEEQDSTIEVLETTTTSNEVFQPIIEGICFDKYRNCHNYHHLCYDKHVFEMMHANCSLTCGNCVIVTEDGDRPVCTDASPKCANFKHLCYNKKYQMDMSSYCRKTCGHCDGTCLEQLDRCAELEEEGFCLDERYTEQERKYICGKTCKFC